MTAWPRRVAASSRTRPASGSGSTTGSRPVRHRQRAVSAKVALEFPCPPCFAADQEDDLVALAEQRAAEGVAVQVSARPGDPELGEPRTQHLHCHTFHRVAPKAPDSSHGHYACRVRHLTLASARAFRLAYLLMIRLFSWWAAAHATARRQRGNGGIRMVLPLAGQQRPGGRPLAACASRVVRTPADLSAS